MLKAKIECEYSEFHPESWQPLPEVLGARGANWKLLHVSPESGSWTAAFFIPKVHRCRVIFMSAQANISCYGGSSKFVVET